MKVTRTLIYEGDPAWIAGTLARGAIAESREFSCPKGTIREGGLVVREDDGRPGELPTAAGFCVECKTELKTGHLPTCSILIKELGLAK